MRLRGRAEDVANRAQTILCSRGALHVLRAGLVFSALVLCLQLVLGISGITRTEKFVGPFAVETPGSNALIVHLTAGSIVGRLLGSGGDSPNSPYASSMTVTVNGIPLAPAHTLHDSIRNGEGGHGAFSHWGDSLVFSLPQGVANSEAAVLRAVHPLSIHGILVVGSLRLLLAVALLLAGRGYILDRSGFHALAARGHDLFFFTSRIVWVASFCAAGAYLATVGYGFVDGWYLPNTAVFSYFPWLRSLARFEPVVPHLILLYALFGALFAWTIPGSGTMNGNFQRQEQGLVVMFDRFGLVFVLGLFLFSVAGTWAGIARPQDPSGNALGGLIPFSDASDHFFETFFQAFNGHWDALTSRRPLAAAIRSVGMLSSGYSNALFLGLQTILMALATYFAMRSIMRWRGLWAGLTFLGLSIIVVRPYLSTNLTEPLGILFAMVSIPYFVQSITRGTTAAKGVSLLLTCWALTIRMGSMFFIPALGLWTFLSSERTFRARRDAVLVVLASVLFVFGLNSVLSNLYGSKNGETGSNFSYTFCGLTHDGDWTTCNKIYSAELNAVNGGEAERAKVLYRLGFEKLVADPTLFVRRVIWNATKFTGGMPIILLRGYTHQKPRWFPEFIWIVAVFYGLYRLFRNAASTNEKTFWGFFLLSSVASAAIIFSDNGVRVLCVSYPLLSLLVASAFSSRDTDNVMALRPGGAARAMNWFAGGLIVAVSISCLTMPGVAYKSDAVNGRSLKEVKAAPGENVFLASRYMSGFLVMPDGMPLRKDVPSVHLRAFREIVANSGVEQYEKLPLPAHPATPFGVVSAPGLLGNGGSLLILPQDVLFNRAALGWKMSLSAGRYWRRVERESPISGAVAKRD